MATRPTVTVRCVADQYAGSGERIIEFSDTETEQGGLISFRRHEGRLVVDVYRCDPGVTVRDRACPIRLPAQPGRYCSGHLTSTRRARWAQRRQ